MATDMPARTHAADTRWERMWSHREQLLKVARRRSMSREDAEDAVHEAMLRAAERPDLDDERLAAWLTTVTMRLCVDRHRQVSREAEVHTSPTLVAPGPVPVDEAVCDRAEARWLAVRSGELPARQAEALRLKSQDLDVAQVAVRMGLSYRTVESLLARARRTLRDSLAGTLGLALFLIGRGKLSAGGKVQAAAAASTVATLAVAGLCLPSALEDGGRGAVPRPSASPSAEALRADGAGDGPRLVEPPRSRPAGPDREAGGPQDGGALLPLPVPPLPGVSPLSGAAVPSVPGVPTVPELPDLPVGLGEPPAPAAEAAPSVPDAGAAPSAPLPVPTPSPSAARLP